ncbi:MAG TPA: class I SAM-dependent methyltransferase [Herpetosiphonaceae bacterium]
MALAGHYVDPRLVALYDLENGRGADTDFYRGLAADAGARTIVDLGCGTGLLTCELALAGCQVIGVDPSPAMLAVARAKPGAELVRWIEGDARSLAAFEADLALMTGNVAQVFLDDEAWAATLAGLHGALRPDGLLAFESRNPADRAWERWTPAATAASLDTPAGPVTTWLEVVDAVPGLVRLRGYNRFEASGELVTAGEELRFRSREELAGSLERAGFVVEQLYGGWERGPLTDASRLMIFVARRG